LELISLLSLSFSVFFFFFFLTFRCQSVLP
jgi:hypothetical protein